MKKRKIVVVLYQAIKSINSDNEIEPSMESEQRTSEHYDSG